METMPAIATILPPRTRLHELKQSAHFPFDEVQHSIKTWVNMASLLVKQGLMAESQRDDENAYISYIRACMIMTKIIPHQTCYAAMMNDIACIDLRQKILCIVSRVGRLERQLLEKFEKDNQLQMQQQQQQQRLQPSLPAERFLRVTSPEPPVIEARTSSLSATVSRPSSTEPQLSCSMNGERILAESRQAPPSPPSSDGESPSKEDDDYHEDDSAAASTADEYGYSPSTIIHDKSDRSQTRGEKNDGTRRAAHDDDTAEEAEVDEEERDTNMLKVDMEQNSILLPRRGMREPPEILLLEEDDPILEYGAKDQICQARVQVDVVDDNEIVISERGSSTTAVEEEELHSMLEDDNDDDDDNHHYHHHVQEDIAEEESELTFDLSYQSDPTRQEKAGEEDLEDDDLPRTRVSTHEALDLDLEQASYAIHRRKFLQQQNHEHKQQQQGTTATSRPRYATAPLSFPAGNMADEKNDEDSYPAAVAPRPRQSLTIYRTASHDRDERSAFYQHMPELEGNYKRTSHQHEKQPRQPHVRRCSSSEALSRSGSLAGGAQFPGKYFPQSPQQQQQQQRISPPPRSPHRISVQILTHFPVSAPLPTPPPAQSLSFSQQMQQQPAAATGAAKYTQPAPLASTGRGPNYHHQGDLDLQLPMTPTGRPSLSPSSPRQSMDQMSVQGTGEMPMSPPFPSNKASSGSLPLNLYHPHRRVTAAATAVQGLGHASAGSMSSTSSVYSSPVSSPMLVQGRQMSGGDRVGVAAPSSLPPSSLPSPVPSNVARMAGGTASTVTTMSTCSEGSTVASYSSSTSNHAPMSSISSTTTFGTAISGLTLVSSRPMTPPTMPTPGAPPAPASSTTMLHSFRKPGLLRKIRSRPKLGDHPIFEMVDTATPATAAAQTTSPLGLMMHANANASLRG